MKKVKIVVVEWNGYPLTRLKKFGDKQIQCGVAPLLEGMECFAAGLEFEVQLMVNCSEGRWYYPYSPLSKHYRAPKEEYLALKERFPFLTGVSFRGNEGMDLGAYNEAMFEFRKQGFDGDVVFMNSSVRPPVTENWLSQYKQILDSNNGEGICGITLNSHNTNLKPPVFAPHVQSFLIYTNMAVLEKVFPQGFPTSDGTLDKLALIEHGEIGISKKVLEAGYGIACRAFPEFFFRQGEEWTIPKGDLRSLPEFAEFTNQL